MDTDEDIHMTAATSGDHTDLERDSPELRHSIDDSHDRVIEVGDVLEMDVIQAAADLTSLGVMYSAGVVE